MNEPFVMKVPRARPAVKRDTLPLSRVENEAAVLCLRPESFS